MNKTTRNTIIFLVVAILLATVALASISELGPATYYIDNDTSANFSWCQTGGNASVYIYTKTNRSAQYTENVSNYFAQNASG